MDRFDAMRVFTRVVERRSFSLAAEDLGLPRSTVTDAVKGLEARLGVRLLERTTRTVRATLDGEAHYRRCLSLIADLEDAEGAFGGARPKGLLRLEVQGTLARHFLLPNLPGFLAEYPDIEINMSESDRWVDLIREGVDCVLRFGKLPDSDMIARQVTMLERLTCATPDYLARFGTPVDPFALDGHRMIGIRSLTTGRLRPMEFVIDGVLKQFPLPAPMSVTGPESYLASAKLGLGLVQVPRFHAETDLANGTLVPVLQQCPPPSVPVNLLYPRDRQLSPRVRVFIDYVMRAFARS
ncbi:MULTISPECIES: LysR family transcriptional regulator [Bradyrhizobium]|uniref:DNA-binding transcriptional LysR family regulator n=1 Tax=Bradyrhizobium elkanii TaxID=29448 RepID=A0A1E3EWQ7_BRAEL|nr:MULTISPECIES: LysR family transcriptional regulator [Bradyrhizobium]MBP1291119.1 DNA-binding transcriptional LysR family regulator [Bradyrhizobium elkanii]MCP1928564.1 DNA-binding transcriptional LysR family regulator [Bradyrhizobium elkanii]MCS3474112.1 DNA-binding transcriptional LysR family regulator [Bradyrhizobium elkanii]MCS3580820.1 DNA-binding transcriptional LysR family regulator [Bradyrhizobium elkanii]MCS3723696.1 DNA-binding transcriptional LysR family regulator [Bradyrhizobium 